MPFAVTWRDLEMIILSKISQKEKFKYHLISHMWNLKKNDTNELIYKMEIESKMQKTNIRSPRGDEGREK